MIDKFFRKKKNTHYYLKNLDQQRCILSLRDFDLIKQIEMIQLTEHDLKIIKAIHPVIQENIEAIVNSFYQTVLNVPHLKSIISNHSTTERLKTTLNQHLIELFNGTIDESFIQKRARVASAHIRIGLEPKWYLCAFQNLLSTLLNIIHTKISDPQEQKQIISAVTKILNLEQQIVLELYEKENSEQKMKQVKEMENLQTRMLEVSEELLALSQQTNAAVEMLITNSNEVNNNVGESTRQSSQTQQLAHKGKNQINELSKQINTISQNTENVTAMVNNLYKSFQEISEFITIVQDIANQTNLLSLNSAIEAARAGEHGKGFAVVAGEVRKLAEQTKLSTTNIQQLIDTSNQYMDQTVKSIQTVTDMVEIGKDGAMGTETTFHDIMEEMNKNFTFIKGIEKQIYELTETIHEIGEATSRVAQSAELLTQSSNLKHKSK